MCTCTYIGNITCSLHVCLLCIAERKAQELDMELGVGGGGGGDDDFLGLGKEVDIDELVAG